MDYKLRDLVVSDVTTNREQMQRETHAFQLFIVMLAEESLSGGL